MLSCVQLTMIPWTVAHQAPLFVEFSREEYWSGLPFPSPGDLPNPWTEPGLLPDPGIEQVSWALPADSLLTELWGEAQIDQYGHC